MRSWARAASTQLMILAVSLIVCELVLQVLAASPIGLWLEPTPRWVHDAALKIRGNPAFPGHDARGYRNAKALSHADVVTMGDSHTYGVGVERQEAWPALLSLRIDRRVYSMAHGGYGPSHYARMLTEALTLRPAIVLVALYLGNDFYDAYALARGTPVPPGLADLAARAAAADRILSIDQQASELWAGSPSLRGWLGSHLQLYRLTHRVRERFRPSRPVSTITPQQRGYLSVGDVSRWHTILRPAYRQLAVDQRDPRIMLGFERSVAAIVSIAARCRDEHVAILVIIFPTKESVFWPHIQDGDRHRQLREIVDDESAFRARLSRRFRDADIATLDLLPDLRAATTQPYPETLDGHPNPVGHRIIADRVAGWVRDHL